MEGHGTNEAGGSIRDRGKGSQQSGLPKGFDGEGQRGQ